MDPNRFSEKNKVTLAKRAANCCSNPSCQTPTSGPHLDEDKSVNVGVAAHIRGANPTSARYDENMQPKERKTITNGIWLCQSCSKLIDDDEDRYTVEVLYNWKRRHEETVQEKMGMSKEENHRRRRLKEDFNGESHAALQIALDRPDSWKVRLIAELIRSRIGLYERKAEDLSNGLVHATRNSYTELREWGQFFSSMIAEYLEIITTLARTIHELSKYSSGKIDDSSPQDILHAVNHLENIWQSFYDWDYRFYFSRWPSEIKDLHEEFKGWTTHYLNVSKKLAFDVSEVVESQQLPPSGSINVSIDLPPEAEEYLIRLTTALGERGIRFDKNEES